MGDSTMDGRASDYETLIASGIQASENIDAGRWKIGDLALKVVGAYGADLEKDFAHKINVSYSRVKQYRLMCDFYPQVTRVTLAEYLPTVSYSHMRVARRFKSLEKAKRFLLQCADQDWTVERAAVEARRILGESLPPKTLLNTAGRIEHISVHPGEPPRAVLVLDQGVDVFALERCKGLVAQLIVMEASKEETSDSSLPVSPEVA